MTRPPPPRYRVVERGRRLEVIDTRADRPGRPRRQPAPGDGGRSFSTRVWFDDKGPRRISLGADDVQRLRRITAPLAAVVVATLASLWWLGFAAVLPLGILIGVVSQHGRGWLTRWFDRHADPAWPTP